MSSRPGRARRACLLAALALVGAPAAAVAAPGELDPTFGDAGEATVDLGGSESAPAIALRPDGRILLGGAQSGGTGDGLDAIVVQVLADSGAPDLTFGLGTGLSRLDRSSEDGVTDLALRPDGRIVVAGYTEGDGLVARLLGLDGTSDPSFGGGDGVVKVQFGLTENLAGLALQPDGRIVVGGYGFPPGTGSDAIVARIPEAGDTFDATFAGTGGFTEDFGSTDMSVEDVALQPDGRIVYTGVIETEGSRNIIIGRLLTDGENDPSFGSGSGRTVIDLGGFDYGASIAVQPDGRILVAGARVTLSGTGDNFAVVRLLPNGLPDPTFAGGGSTAIDFGANESASSVLLQPDGRILVAGGMNGGPSGNDDMVVARLLADGSLDPVFGTRGRAIVDFGAWEGDVVGMALRPDGRILLTGGTRPTQTGASDIAIARLLGDDPAAPGPTPPSAAAPAGPVVTTRVSARCGGRAATIVGTPGPDQLRGTPGPDVVAALAGDDRVSGLGGADIICGGAGADRLVGGRGADRLIGGAGPDRLLGGLGADRLLGGPGADRLLGGLGLDALIGGAGRNVRVQ